MGDRCCRTNSEGEQHRGPVAMSRASGHFFSPSPPPPICMMGDMLPTWRGHNRRRDGPRGELDNLQDSPEPAPEAGKEKLNKPYGMASHSFPFTPRNIS